MKPWIKTTLRIAVPILVLLLLVFMWLAYFHNDLILQHSPKFLQGPIKNLGMHVDTPPPEEESPDPNLNEIPVHVGKIQKVDAMHRYIDGIGVVAPRPPRGVSKDAPADAKPAPAGTANVAALIPGQIDKIDCSIGQTVKAGDTLVELDARAAKAAQEQAAAALEAEKAALAALIAPPRQIQIDIATLAIEKAKSAVDLAQKNYDRQKQLLAEQSVSSKTVEQAAGDLAAANNDLQAAQKQLDLLKTPPRPEDITQEQAKVAQAAAAFEAAKLQTQLTIIKAPIDGTVTAISANPGEPVDPTKPIITLVAMDRLMVDVDIPADELPEKAEGLAVTVTLGSDVKNPGSKATLDAKVTLVAPQVESKNGAVMLGIDLPADAAKQGFLPGRTVRVRIIAEEHKNVLAVPRESIVLDDNGDPNVAVVKDSVALMHAVATGLEEDGKVEVTTDLPEGTVIVTQGAFGLRTVDETLQQTRVKVLEDKK